MAQLVERWRTNTKVVGSNPTPVEVDPCMNEIKTHRKAGTPKGESWFHYLIEIIGLKKEGMAGIVDS